MANTKKTRQASKKKRRQTREASHKQRITTIAQTRRTARQDKTSGEYLAKMNMEIAKGKKSKRPNGKII